MVTAVAPLPTTTTRLPAWSRSSGQNWGWTMRPHLGHSCCAVDFPKADLAC
jgi:hypothetical protein